MLDNSLSPDILLYTLLGGIIPAVFWLKFWLRESTHQEPRGLIFGSFLGGMGVVFLALPIQGLVNIFFFDNNFLSITLWAFSEELLKFGAAYFIAIRTRFADEPIDATIYLITAALGFAALENIFFVSESFFQGNVLHGLVTLNHRFVGANLLHVISSGVIGISLGFAFYKSNFSKRIAGIIGLALATLLHTAFNSFIISNDQYMLVIFSAVWIGLIIVILILEQIKKVKHIV